jgi:excisionase family DNA binding protein
MTQTTFHLFFIGKVTSLTGSYLKMSEVAEIYRVSPRTVRAWTKLEIEPLEAYEVGGQIRIPESALHVFVKPVMARRISRNTPSCAKPSLSTAMATQPKQARG